MPEQAVLRIHAHGKFEIELMAAFFSDLNYAYSSIYLAGVELDYLARYEGDFLYGYFGRRRPFINRFGIAKENLAPENVANSVPRSQRLILNSITLNSPGILEVLGALNPLEVGRKWLCDRHERKKDEKYRDPAEARKLEAEARRVELDNLLTENRIFAEKIEMAKKLGATDNDLAPLLNNLIGRPLERLDKYQDKGLIEDAEFVVRDDKSLQIK